MKGKSLHVEAEFFSIEQEDLEIAIYSSEGRFREKNLSRARKDHKMGLPIIKSL